MALNLARILIAAPLLAYVIASVWGVNEDARRDEQFANRLAQAEVLPEIALTDRLGELDGQLVIIQGALTGPPARDPATGAELQAAKVKRSVRIRKQVSSSGNPSLGTSGRIWSTKRWRWVNLDSGRWPAELRNQAPESAERVRLGPFDLPVSTLRASTLSQLGNRYERATGGGFEPANDRRAAEGRIGIFYHGIPYQVPSTLSGTVIGDELSRPDDGRQPLLLVPESLNGPELASYYRENIATTPRQYGWLYSVVLWPVLILLLPPLCRAPGLRHRAFAQRTLNLFAPLRWALALPVAVLFFQILVLTDRFVPL